MSYIGNEPIVSATRTITEITATAGQTVFTANGGYTVGYIDVFLNGAQLQTVDFTATDGSSITLTEAAQVGDVLKLVAWGTFSTSNLVSPNYTGTLTGGTGVVNIGSGQVYKDASGNLGIGTSSPAFKLDVSATGNILGRFKGTGTLSALFLADANTTADTLYIGTVGNNFRVITNSEERMIIDSSGNVGIGTSSPTEKLQVAGVVKSSASGNLSSGAGAHLYYTSGTSSAELTALNPGVAWLNQNYNALSHVWNGSGTERMRIDSSGNLLVGSTTNLNTPRLFVKNISGDANNPVMNMQCQATSVATTMIGFYDGAVSFCGQIYVDPASNTTVYSTSSDYRLKDNVASMTGALDKVSALKPVTYTWKKSGKASQGFIAHELQEIAPECVIGEKDAVDEDGKIIPQMIDTSFLVATLTAAIQEQQAQLTDMSLTLANANAIITEQSLALTDLKSRIETLESK